MALRELEKRLAALETRAAGEQLDWQPLENCLLRISGKPTLRVQLRPGMRVATIEDVLDAERGGPLGRDGERA